MINEAFWFFYLLDLVGTLRTVGAVFFIIGMFVSVFATISHVICVGNASEYDEESRNYRYEMSWAKNWAGVRRLAVFVLLAGSAGLLMPSENTVLAGGGQFIAEEAELTDTLMRVKSLVDQRLDEIIEGETASE